MSDRLEGMPFDELPEMTWNTTTLAFESNEVAQIMEHLATISEAAELRMTNATWPMLQRLLYTSFEFSSLPSRGVGCVGCAPSSEPVGGCKNPTRLLPRVQQRIRTSATELRIDIDQQTLCGHKSYFGESGATDAFEGLMEILRLRLGQHHPREPWSEPKEARWPIPKNWFARRSEYYATLVKNELPVHTLLRAVPPASRRSHPTLGRS